MNPNEIKTGDTYWGIVVLREEVRKVNMIDTRKSGITYVNWTRKKRDGSDGESNWTELNKFSVWVIGLYEKGTE
jgi:hypothetical protein